MTIPTTASKVTQQGNGVTILWPYAFEIPGATPSDQTNVTVTLYDTTQSPPLTTVLTDNLFSITGVGSNVGGNVTYPLGGGTPIAPGVSITIERTAPYVQDTSIPNQSAFYPKVLEAALDYLTMLVQQLLTQVTYSIKFPLTDTLPPEPLPGAKARASTLLGFDADGALTLYGISSGGGTPGVPEYNYRTVTSSTAMVATDVVLRCNCSTGNQSNTLPAVATVAGHMLFLKKIDSSNNGATFSGDATIDGAASYTLAQQYNTVVLFSNGSTWDVISQF